MATQKSLKEKLREIDALRDDISNQDLEIMAREDLHTEDGYSLVKSSTILRMAREIKSYRLKKKLNYARYLEDRDK